MYRKSLFLFHRDLRIEDNTALFAALKNSLEVIPVFIFTPEQIVHNPYRSDHAIQFMLESLLDLDKALQKKKGRLYLFLGSTDFIVLQCIKKLGIDALFSNKDYTPYSKARDKKLEKLCQKHGIAFNSYDDALLHSPSMYLKSDKTPYVKFTSFFHMAKMLPVSTPKPHPKKFVYSKKNIPFEKTWKQLLPKILKKFSKDLPIKGGRQKGLQLLKKSKNLMHYPTTKNYPSLPTTFLSAHLKFTTLSCREVFHVLKKYFSKNHELIRQLYWRDFFTMIAHFFPKIFGFSFYAKYDQKLLWKKDKTKFLKWCKGQTGIPIVDAGMRELNTTGFMHNRARMITASFLIKDLHIDWRWGERYFAQKLIDYDPAINNGNWQWVASCGADAMPYFRIFNPWSQQKKYDPKCVYIKKWVKELENVSPNLIHSLHDRTIQIKHYPLPIIYSHDKEIKKVTLPLYRKVFK